MHLPDVVGGPLANGGERVTIPVERCVLLVPTTSAVAEEEPDAREDVESCARERGDQV